jgi:hypothetical protein
MINITFVLVGTALVGFILFYKFAFQPKLITILISVYDRLFTDFGD